MEIKDKLDISVVIVNYKSWNHLDSCLTSLLNFSDTSFSSEIIVVDNCSNDGKLSEFEKQFSSVYFFKNSGNNGFANGCNFGASKASGKYLIFLNPDTLANEEAFQKMLQYYKKNPKTGIVSCLQKNKKGDLEKSDRVFPSLFTLFGFFRIFYKIFAAKKVASNNILKTDWVSGSLVFISKEWFENIQGWNEDYWMYYEDIDICKRVSNANGEVIVLTDVHIIHNHGGASRINVKTASITKTEVFISKHVYIQNNFGLIENLLSQVLLILVNIISKLIASVFGILLFFIPKARLQLYIAKKLFAYYLSALFNFTWKSKRSLNY